MDKHLGKKIILTALLLILLTGGLLVPRLGHWLVAEDPLQEGDIVVILMGSVPDRVLEAAEVYRGGMAGKVVMVDSHRVGYDILLERGVDIPGSAQLSQAAAVGLGVPAGDIIILEGEARSTQDEAVILREYLRENEGVGSIILVTSRFHSARSKKIFARALAPLDRDIGLISRPSRYDTFDPQAWWKDREDAKRVVTEYLKLLNFYLREQFQLG